jgi:SAM-dependent methyltransferase
MDPRDHWQRVYDEKDAKEVSWYRPHLDTSLSLIRGTGVPRTARIIDVGGGAATLVDDLLERGFEAVTVFDVSAIALEKAKYRLGDDSVKVKWLTGDVTEADLGQDRYDLWHDRAVLHFLTEADDRQRYARVLRRALAPDGHVILAAFAPHGPEKCSGLPVRRHGTADFVDLVGEGFALRGETVEIHVTPSGNKQPFAYCWFERAVDDSVATV